jgi:hypothetical protein
MKVVPRSVTYEVEVGPGECLRLPDDLAAQFPEGTWVLTITAKGTGDERFYDHEALLAGYSDDDEGLYDDA